MQNLLKLRDITAKGGSLSADERAAANSISADTMNALAKAETGSNRAPSKEEHELLKEQIPEHPAEFQFKGILGANPNLAKVNEAIKAVEAKRIAAGLPPTPQLAGPTKPSYFTPGS
jgi:hypothetical protein